MIVRNPEEELRLLYEICGHTELEDCGPEELRVHRVRIEAEILITSTISYWLVYYDYTV